MESEPVGEVTLRNFGGEPGSPREVGVGASPTVVFPPKAVLRLAPASEVVPVPAPVSEVVAAPVEAAARVVGCHRMR